MRKITFNNNSIVADPTVCHGQPVFKGTRIMVWQVLDLLASGVGIEEIIKDYFPRLDKKAIVAALQYASHLIEGERYAIFPQKQLKVAL
ncbi:MAG: DUF433 domain-containing protein [bacterium]|nr:DUF433 domain-containing protein [bacterium]